MPNGLHDQVCQNYSAKRMGRSSMTLSFVVQVMRLS